LTIGYRRRFRFAVAGGTASTTHTYTSTHNQLASTVSGATTLSNTHDANGARTASDFRFHSRQTCAVLHAIARPAGLSSE